MLLVRIVLLLFIFLACESPAFSNTPSHQVNPRTVLSDATDSINFHLRGLSDALHRVDSLLSSLKGQHFNFHLDSMSFGPFETPEIHIPKIDIPQFNIHVPDTMIPPQSIPRIQIPEINKDISLDSEWSGVLIPDVNETSNNSVSGTLELSKALSSNVHVSTPRYTKHYYFDGNRQYFINNPLWAYAERSQEGKVNIGPVDIK